MICDYRSAVCDRFNAGKRILLILHRWLPAATNISVKSLFDATPLFALAAAVCPVRRAGPKLRLSGNPLR